MAPKRQAQQAGLHMGPYEVAKFTHSDVTVTAAGPNGTPVVVGRFPFTRQIDAMAQAVAYAVMPDLIRAARRLLDTYEDTLKMTDEQLRAAAIDPAASARVNEQAAAILQTRATLRKAGAE